MKVVGRPLKARVRIPSRMASTEGRWSAVAEINVRHCWRRSVGKRHTSVHDDIVLGGLLSDGLLVVQVTIHDCSSRLLDSLAMFLSSNETGHFVSFGDQKIEDVPANESRTDDKDVLSLRHFCGLLLRIDSCCSFL